jgi:hypothetical protein
MVRRLDPLFNHLLGGLPSVMVGILRNVRHVLITIKVMDVIVTALIRIQIQVHRQTKTQRARYFSKKLRCIYS